MPIPLFDNNLEEGGIDDIKAIITIMRKELKRYSSIGNRAGILLLCRKVLTGNIEDLSSIGASCSFINGIDLNFKCGIIALRK